MAIRVRVLLSLAVLAAITLSASCGHYTCSATFGSSTCTPSGSGIGTTGGNNGPAAAVVLYIQDGGNVRSMGSAELTTSAGQVSLIDTPGFSNPALPSLVSKSQSYTVAIAGKKFVYVPYGPSGQLFAWSIDPTTQDLVDIAGSPFPAAFAAGIPSVFVVMQPIAVTPNGNFLYIADAADQLIVAFQIDQTTGVPTQISSVSTAGVIAPWNLTTDGTGKFLYVTEGNDFGEGQNIAVYSINQTTGGLSGGVSLGINLWQVATDSSGKFLIGDKGENGNQPDQLLDQNLWVYNINPLNGTLTPVSGSPFATTNAPNWVIIHPNGKFVYDFSISHLGNSDGPLEGFSLDSTTGMLTGLTGSPFSNLVIPFGGMFDQTGTYLFLHVPNELVFCTVDATSGIPTQSPSTLHILGDLPWTVSDAQ